MPFAAGLRDSLQLRGSQLSTEFTRGDSLERMLDRDLLAVEQMADGELITSILLLSPDGRTLSHGSAPNLPRSYREAIDGVEIGPSVGSCGTAAYFGQPVYVTDIAADSLWDDYRYLALSHGLRSCWSTPIRDIEGVVIGTFAIYRRTPGCPTKDELDAIAMITEHVAQAIMWARDAGFKRAPPRLRLVCDNDAVRHGASARPDGLLLDLAKLESIATDLERYAIGVDSEKARAALRAVAEDSRNLVRFIRFQIQSRDGSGA